MKQIILPQIVSIGIYNAQIAIKNKIISNNRKTTMFEVELPIIEGGISYIDNTSHAVSENLIICAKPGQMRHTKLPFKCYYIHMIVNEGQIFDILSSLPNYINVYDSAELKELFVSMCEHYDTGIPEDDIILQSLILKLIYVLDYYTASHKAQHNPKRNNHKIIDKALQYINANLSADLSLDALCEQVNFTPIYFHKLFKASTGKTLREYVEEQRIKKSIELLVSTEMTLTQIAYECGFSSQSYFSYVFKKKTKYTPRDYAKNILKKYEK